MERDTVGVEGTLEEVQARRWYVNSFRQAAGKQGAAYGVEREAGTDVWTVKCYLPSGNILLLGNYDYETALRVQDYCVQRDTVVKMALIEFWEKANTDPLTTLLENAQSFGELPRRRVRLTIECDFDMRGTDEEIKVYALQHVRSSTRCRAARVVDFNGPRIEEPRVKGDIV